MTEITVWRKRPVEVSAVQWTGGNIGDVFELTGCEYFDSVDAVDLLAEPDITAHVFDKLHSTWVGVKDGQWIIRGVKGEFYPCDDDVFAETYEAADADAPPPVGRGALEQLAAVAAKWEAEAVELAQQAKLHKGVAAAEMLAAAIAWRQAARALLAAIGAKP